ncbi:MAG TPA: ABC transporter permease [Actinomycetes bacterium]|nr:ABC transporter permease [Actinomycetes bacterium]
MSAPSPASAESPLSAEPHVEGPQEGSARTLATQPAHRPSILARGQMIWASRRILRILVIRDLKVRYSDTILGFAWTLLDPLLLTLVYWFVFGVIVARGAPDEQPYLLWLLTGILPFQWTAHVLGDSGRLLGNDAKLVTASSLPREIWVLRSVSSRFIEFLFTLPITAVAMVLFGVFTDYYVGPSAWLFAIPLAFAVQFIFNVGLALTLAPMCMLYPDVHRIVRVFTTLYRYLSPVIYGLVFLETTLRETTWPSWLLIGDQTWPEWMMWLYVLNPLVGILNTYHAVIFPNNTDDVWLLLALSSALSGALFVIGLWVFRRLEPRVLKEL